MAEERIVVLSEEHKQAIEQALQLAKVLKEEIKRANLAGIPVDVSVEQVAEAEAQLLSIKRVYFPAGRRV